MCSLVYPVCTLEKICFVGCLVTSLGARTSSPAAAASNSAAAAACGVLCRLFHRRWLLLRCIHVYQWFSHHSPLRCRSASTQYITHRSSTATQLYVRTQAGASFFHIWISSVLTSLSSVLTGYPVCSLDKNMPSEHTGLSSVLL